MSRFERLNTKKISLAANLALGGIALALAKNRNSWRQRYEAAEQQRQAAEQKSHLDPKTGLLNYPFFSSEVIRRTASIQRLNDAHRQHGLILLDIDNFKALNDRLTMPVVDQVALLPVAQILKQSVRPENDLAGRFGGDEFVIFLGDTDPMGTLVVAERLRAQANAIQLEPNVEKGISLTMAYTSLPQGSNYEEIYRQLNNVLNNAKAIPGKNQIASLAA